MITVNLDELLLKIKSSETKDVLGSGNIAVFESQQPSLQEREGNNEYYKNIETKSIKDFVKADSAHERTEVKKFKTLCTSVIKSNLLSYSDLGKKVFKSIAQFQFFDLVAILLEKKFNSIDDESLSVILYEVFNDEDDFINENDTIYKQCHEALNQDSTTYRTFHIACTDLLDFPEDDTKSFQKYFSIYIVYLLCQKPIDKIWFMRALLKLRAKQVKALLEILYFLADSLCLEFKSTKIRVSEKTIYEYISLVLSSSYEKLKKDKSNNRLFGLISNLLERKAYESEALTALDNLSSIIESQSLQIQSVDLRKNLNVEEFMF